MIKTLAQVKSMSLLGLDGHLINVQVDVSSGLPSWDIVGLPDISVKESKQRVRSVFKNIGISLPSRKITINLAPANLKKEGSYFDLPIAIGILCAFHKIEIFQLQDTIFVGELSLDGSLNPVKGILSICIEATKMGIKNIFLPYENRIEAGVIHEINVYPVHSILEILEHFNGVNKLNTFKINIQEYLSNHSFFLADFAEVNGQESAKRALEIAAAGNHNCILIGPPGSGKTMLAQRIPSILPDLTFPESLEITKIHSITGTHCNSFIATRPFRSPHHTISKSALVGGRKNSKTSENLA